MAVVTGRASAKHSMSVEAPKDTAAVQRCASCGGVSTRRQMYQMACTQVAVDRHQLPAAAMQVLRDVQQPPRFWGSAREAG